MNLNLRQVEAFVQLARLGGFSRAAAQLHVSQAGLSILIRKLEDKLAMKLVERTTRSVSLTPAGHEILPMAERMLADAEAILSSSRGIVAQHSGRIALALPPMLAGTVLPEVLKRFRDDHPRVAVAFRECVNEELIGRIYARDVEFGLAFGVQASSELVCQPVLEDELAVACLATHRLARKRVVRWRDLAGEPIITHATGSIARTLTENAFMEAGLLLTPAYEATNSLTALALAAEGLGLAVVSSASTPAAMSGALVLKVLREPLVKRHLQLVTRRGAVLSPPALAFVEVFAGCMKAARGLAVGRGDTPGKKP